MVSKENFLVKEIPDFNPVSQYYDRLNFWKTHKRRCIEGYWSSGIWMPGRLYFYVNFWNIELKKSKDQNTLSYGRPALRDIEWEKAYLTEEARGFSGFSDDTRYTCNELYHPDVREKNEERNLIPRDNLIYETPRYYLRKDHGSSKGKPLYENQAKNVVELGARGFGKTFFTAGAIVAHNFLFDGATDYDVYLQELKNETPISSQTMVGAINSTYSQNLLSKFESGYDLIPGSTDYLGQHYPAPLSKYYRGSLKPAEQIEAYREVKVGSNWVRKGSRSKIYHRTFKDNPFAAAGTRPSIIVLDEVGFMGNLTEALGPLKDCTEVGGDKFGTIWMTGTGGSMDSGTTGEVQKVFENPEAYDCVAFEDTYENKGQIGFFVPVHYTFDKYRDEEGNVDMELAQEEIDNNRKIIERSSDPVALANEMQNRPTKPSEAFLVTQGNQFPVNDAKARLSELEADPKKYRNAHFTGSIRINDNGEAEWEENRDAKVIREFPINSNKNKDGAIEIFQKPKLDSRGHIPPGRYIAGLDPFDDDEASTKSLGSLFVFDLFLERIVAEYTSRPNTADEYYENAFRLLKYYHAVCNYENNLKGFFGYLRNKGALHYLADTPEILKDMDMATTNTMGNKAKGTRATQEVNRYARSLYKQWLLSPAQNMPDGVLNIHTVRSEGLLKETINYNDQGNFDRISAIGMVMILKEDRAKMVSPEQQKRIRTKAQDPFFKRKWEGEPSNTFERNNLPEEGKERYWRNF